MGVGMEKGLSNFKWPRPFGDACQWGGSPGPWAVFLGLINKFFTIKMVDILFILYSDGKLSIFKRK